MDTRKTEKSSDKNNYQDLSPLPHILAHDLGTTGNKATLYDAAGRLIESCFQPYPTHFPANGWAEQNPDDWWRAVCTSTRQLLDAAGISPADVACVVFSGQMQGVVALDKHTKPLHSALIWMDLRATAQVEKLTQRLSVQDVYRITGHRLSASYSLAKILWLRDHQPEVFRSAHKFVCPKDAMIARLTGRFVTEPSDASGMNAYDLATGAWSERILDAADLSLSQFPEIVISTEIVGGVRPEVADEIGLKAGTPVVAGGGDGACASVGAGSIAEGIAYSYIGSSAWIAGASRAPLLDETMRVFTFGHVITGLFIPIGAMQTAGAAYQWARDQLAPLELQSAEALGLNAFDLMNLIAEKSPAGANDLLFLPYLAGERAPRWNPNARASFIGLTIRHTRADMLRAVLEGVAFNLRCILDILHGRLEPFAAIRMIGGGASGRLWTQIMADVYGIPLQRLTTLEEATSMGAAVIGGVGIGLYPGFEVVHAMNPVAETITPNAANRARYDRLVSIFDESYRALEGIFNRLGE